MAEIKPIGIDQTTGQQRQIASGDTLNPGDTIELAIRRVGDYSGGSNQAHALYPWTETPTRLTNPETLLASGGRGVSWSPNGEYLAISGFRTGSSDVIVVYQRVGNSFYSLSEPSSQPPVSSGLAVRDIAFSHSGEFLAAAHDTAVYLTVYQRDGSTFTPLVGISSLPVGANNVAWTPNDQYLAVRTSSAPYLHLYERDGTNFTLLTEPASVPTATSNDANSISWSPAGDILTVSQSVSGNSLLNYQQNNGTLTLLTAPASLADFTTGVDWSPGGKYLATVHSSSPYLAVYSWDGSTLNLLATPASAPAGSQRSVTWSPDGKYLAVGSASPSPKILFYSFDLTSETLTLLSDPSTTPGGNVFDIAWSPDQQYIAMTSAGAGDPSHIYQTDTAMPTSGVVTIIGTELAS